uniref:Retrovirus-related Pol polyprotein from transposon TNT 1-94 n=1 Tax=Cajanus cajan TaxID=3821 RepID=A0A151TJ55_CAJCA|nr:Retrovirus-related Pol polyprotein from transposon TNT 1-94 [Cajanus cajan]
MRKDIQQFVATCEVFQQNKYPLFRAGLLQPYKSHIFQEFLEENGILSQWSCASTPQQNGVAERKNHHLLNVVCTLMLDSFVPSHFWCGALSTIVHLINQLPSPILNNDSPFLRLFGKSPTYSTLFTFGCVCYVHLQPQECTKLIAQSAKCAFLGYLAHQKGFICYDPHTHKIQISRNVIFVVLGNKQKVGLDYEETFTLVAKMITVRIILAITAFESWQIHQLDVKNVFLHGDLKEVCIKFPNSPPSIRLSYPGTVCKLKCSLYGLKQAPKVWFEKFRTILLGFSFLQSSYDPSLFFSKDDLIQLASLTNATAVDTPMEVNVKLRWDEDELLQDPTLYKKLVGSLIYLNITRPDISFVVHLSTKQRIIKYLLATPRCGLFFPTNTAIQLIAYNNVDCAGCLDKRKSTTS